MALECERWQWRELIASENGPSDPSTRLVLLVLSLHMNQVGENAFPAQELIAKRAGLSVRSVRTHLNLAADAEWLRIYQKAQKGKAWFVHEYMATIPDRLAGLRTSKPWVDDPKWERPANDDPTPGNLRHDARQGLPTNSSLNSSGNPPNNRTCNVQQQAAAPRAPEDLEKKSSKPEAPAARPPTLRRVMKGKAEFSDLPKDQREKLALEVMAAVPSQALTWFAREYNLPIEDVERLKLSLSESGALH